MTGNTVEAPVYLWWSPDGINMVPVTLTNPLPVTTSGVVGGAAKPYHLSGGSTSSTNAHVIKASAGGVTSVTLINTSGTVGFFRFYDQATTPDPSSSTNAGVSIPVPASVTGSGLTVPFSPAMVFANGISYVITGGGADNDSSSGPAGIYVIINYV